MILIFKKIFYKLDFFVSILAIPAAMLMYLVRKVGINKLKFSRKVLEKVGVFPILDHYYEPQFYFDKLKQVAPFLSPDRESGSFYIRKIA